jgi:hypothetical protein
MMRSDLALRSIAGVIAAFPASLPGAGVEASIEATAVDGLAISAQGVCVQRVSSDLGYGEGRRPGLCVGMYFPAASRKLFKIISKKVLESVKSDAPG